MFALLKQARTGFFIAMVGLMLTSVISPVLALEATDLVAGDDAVVLKDTKLYSETTRDSDVTAELAKDTPVTIVEGPFTADDATKWYWVRVYEQNGYLQALDLEGVAPPPVEAAPADTTETTDTTEVPATRSWQEPIDFGVANDNVICRADSSTSAQELIRVAVGQTIEVTGAEVWAGGLAWLPVNCAGVGGFIASDFITFEIPTEVPTEVVTEVATEVPTEVVTEVATEVVTEVVTEVPTEVVTEDVTEVVTEIPAQVEVPAEVEAPAEAKVPTEVEAPAEAKVPTEVEAPADAEAVTAGAAVAPIGTAVALDDVVCRVEANTDAVQITVFAAGMTVEVTGPPVDGAGLSWTPVNCSGVGGFVATQYIDAGTAEVPAETATVEATAEAVDNDADETATTAPTDETTEPAATPAATDVATDVATGTPVADESATTEPTEEVVADKATPTEVVTEEVPAEEATAEATNEATEEAVVSGQAVTETDSTIPVEDSAIIGTASVQGTNGAGIACRTAADAYAPIIRVLPEGMSVLVLSEPDANGWMSIICNDEVGFAPVTYLWQGGAASDFSADTSSYANVSATGGAGLNCRSGPGTNHSVIGYFPAGSGINVRGAAQGDWVPVVCGGQNGWVHGDFLVKSTSPTTGGSTGGESTGGNATAGSMVVTGTDGQGLRCRTAPNGSTITVMAEGTRVSVRGASENGWVPITCGGQNGYASGQFLGADGGSTGTDGGTTKPDTGNGSGTTGGTVTVTGTGGVRLNCRTAPNGGVIGSVAEGTVLTVRGATEGGWVPVVCNGANAWVSGLFVTAGGTAPGGSNGNPTPTPDPGNGGTDPSTGTATVVNTEGDSLRCRVAPGGSTITMLAPGSTVTLRAEKSGEWQGVICGGQNGFAHSSFLSTGGGSTPTNPTPTPAPAPAPSGFANGDHGKATASLNLRYEPSSGAGVATVAPSGTVVLITGGAAGNGYYPVNWDGLKGYMHGDFLVKTDEALSKRGGSATPAPGDGGGGGSTASGNAIVDYAMGYVGYPYVWATHGPSSFDCSGFTYWVIKNVVGKNIGTGTWSQVSAGTPVSRNALQPGDLVFFQNTYTAGLSHVGIYIGGNQFVHAQNESTGVVVSDLNSSYYGPRWYGATRVT